jgi:pyruvate,water dikinase
MKLDRSIDTVPHPDFRAYSAGNFAEVAPARWSPVSWSLVGDPVERGMRAFTRRLLPGARWATGSSYVFVGYFACRPYHNLAALCHLAYELPGVRPDDLTRAYFEAASPPERELGRHCGAVERLLAVPRMAREFHRLRPRLASIEAAVVEAEEEVASALASGWQIALGAALQRALDVLDAAWDIHYSTTSSLIPAGAIQRRLGQRRIECWDEIEPLVTRPPELPWSRLFDAALSGEVEQARFLEVPFYEVADGFEPWSRFASPFRPHPPAQVRAPEHAEVAEVVWRMYRGTRKLGVEQLSRAVSDGLQAREESKALAMRCLHLFRRTLPTLAEAAGVAGEEWPYLRIRELLDPGCHDRLQDLIDLRSQECDEALSQRMPDDLVLPDLGAAAPTPVKPQPQRVPSGVSPGLVAGTVATLDRPPSATGNGPVILVCESADAGIQTLLPHVAGLITMRGSMLSHIATLAREYAIPAVVNHPLAQTLQAGQRVVLNGSTGEVEVLS